MLFLMVICKNTCLKTCISDFTTNVKAGKFTKSSSNDRAMKLENFYLSFHAKTNGSSV